jgi:uncharacterized protein YqjF (DUF2071 family)
MNQEDYKRGYDDGFRAALDTLQKTFLPTSPTTKVCDVCRIDISNNDKYVCMVPDCSSNVKVSYMYGTTGTSL